MGKKYTQIPATTFQQLQMNAGIIAKSFAPEAGVVSGLVGATSGGINFSAVPEFVDFGEDVDNCPKNTMELKNVNSTTVTMSGNFITVNATSAKALMAAADADDDDATHIIPRDNLVDGDFEDLWFIGDYSDVNTGDNAGYLAIKIKNALNTAGFSIRTTDKNKGQFAFTYTGHYSMTDPDEVPYEVYIKAGTAAAGGETVITDGAETGTGN